MILSEYFLLLTLRLQPITSWPLSDDKITLTEHRLPGRFENKNIFEYINKSF